MICISSRKANGYHAVQTLSIYLLVDVSARVRQDAISEMLKGFYDAADFHPLQLNVCHEDANNQLKLRT
jgi:hypothetical protein